jgi:cobalt-precorrin-7 (C5)-methyltransferase
MITVVGIGPGDPRYLTFDARQSIEKGDCVVAFGRVADSLKSIRQDFVIVGTVKEVLDLAKEHEDVVILASGDPCFYGILEFLKNKGIKVDNVVPGISSFQYMMTKLNKSWSGASFISLHGRCESLSKIKDSSLTIILTDKENTPSKISHRLYEMGVRGKLYAGFNLSYEDELIVQKNVGDDIEDLSPLAVVVIENEMD